MNYECEKFEEIESPVDMKNPSILQILEELNRLQLENDVLKADKKELLKEIQQLKNDKMVLHNIDENSEDNQDIGILNEYVEEYLCGCESKEELKNYEEALNNMSVKK